VWAVDTFSNVAIEDPVSGVKAGVDPTNRLKVGDGAGPMTIDGSVTATQTQPASFVRIFVFSGSTCSNAYTIPSGKALIIKSMQTFMHSVGAAGDDVETLVYNTADCSGLFVAAAISDGLHKTVSENFEPGIAIPAGRVVSVLGSHNAGSLFLYGYLVPASSVPAGAAAPSDAAPDHASTEASPTGRR
jgi:hypothetical protein